MTDTMSPTAETELELQVHQGLEDVEAQLLDSVSANRDLVDDLTRHLAVAGGNGCDRFWP